MCLDTITVHKVSLIIQGEIHKKYILNYKKAVFVRFKTVPLKALSKKIESFQQ